MIILRGVYWVGIGRYRSLWVCMGQYRSRWSDLGAFVGVFLPLHGLVASFAPRLLLCRRWPRKGPGNVSPGQGRRVAGDAARGGCCLWAASRRDATLPLPRFMLGPGASRDTVFFLNPARQIRWLLPRHSRRLVLLCSFRRSGRRCRSIRRKCGAWPGFAIPTGNSPRRAWGLCRTGASA